MKFSYISFLKGVRGSDEIFDKPFLHLAFYGRSNVGKSSSINTLLGRKNLVKSSSKPGKTKELNFFDIDHKFFIVDLPGYGYAKIAPVDREKLRKMLLWYVIDSGVKNRINVMVLDTKVGLTEYDEQLLEIFEAKHEKVIILLNKIDKLNQKTLHKKKQDLLRELNQENILDIIFFSALKGKGVLKF